jgi:hypothetical protein
LQTNLGLQGTIEQLGQDPFTLGMNVGGRTAQAGGTAAQALLQGGLSAAKTMQGAMGTSPLAAGMFGLTQSPGVNAALNNWFTGSQYNPVQPGQYTPGSDTFMGPMPAPAGYQPQMSWYD